MTNPNFEVELEPSVLRWARERARLSDAVLAERAGVSRERVSEWEQTGRLRIRQVEQLARVTHTPLGYLYLETPPDEVLPLPDFRMLPGTEAHPSPELLDVIDDAERRRHWYREYLTARGGEPLEFIATLDPRSAVPGAVADIREYHGLTADLRRESATWEDALRKEIERIEASGVLVMRNGIVGNNTHRPLDVSEFRGFAIADLYAPIIFINGKDAKGAQMFTLMHELAHLWLGRSGVSNLDKTLPPDNEVERWSNAVAAEILVPETELREAWDLLGRRLDSLSHVTRRFKVSSLVILRRLFDLGVIDRATFRERYDAEEARFARDPAQVESGGDFYRTQTARVSKRFATALVTDTLEGRTGWREAFSLLGVRGTSTFEELARRLRVLPS